MTVEVGAMVGVGVAVLAAGFILVRSRFRAASGAGKVIVLRASLRGLRAGDFCRRTLYCGARSHAHRAALATGSSVLDLFCWRGAAGCGHQLHRLAACRWSASLLALLFLIIVATIDLPNLPKHIHDRFFWMLTVRETAFAGGAMVLAGSVWPLANSAGTALVRLGRALVAHHVLLCDRAFPLSTVCARCSAGKAHAGMDASTDATFVSRRIILLFAGVGLLLRPTVRIAAAGCGHRAAAAHAFLLPSDPPDGDPHSARGGRNQLRGRHLAIRSDCFAGRLRSGEAHNLTSRPAQSSMTI